MDTHTHIYIYVYIYRISCAVLFFVAVPNGPAFRIRRFEQARRLFKEIDIDGSGFISPDEILGQTDTPAVSLGRGFVGWEMAMVVMESYKI